MSIKKTLSIVFTVLLLCTQLSFSANDRQARIKGLRAMSMGGAFSALSDDNSAFFHNPAGISREIYSVQIFSLDAALSDDIIEFSKFYSDNKKDLENFSTLTAEEQTALATKINDQVLKIAPEIAISFPNLCFVSGPIKMSNNYLNVGGGIFPYFDAQLKFNEAKLPDHPTLSLALEANIVAALPVAYRIVSLEDINLPGQLSLGANLKYIYRVKNADNNISVHDLENPDTFTLHIGEGYGMDFGAIYHINSRWNAGIQFLDAFNTKLNYSHADTHEHLYYSSIKPELTVGAAYIPEKIYYWPGKFINSNGRLTLAADITDITNNYTTSFDKKLHIGAELRFLIFALRAGLNSGHFTCGGGIVTNIVDLEYAYYGGEESLLPNANDSSIHRITFSLRLGGKKRKKKEEAKQSEKEQRTKDDTTADDIEPLKLPADTKNIIETPAEINEATETTGQTKATEAKTE